MDRFSPIPEELAKKFFTEMQTFFNDPNPSAETLRSKIHELRPSISIADCLILLYDGCGRAIHFVWAKRINQIVKVLRLHLEPHVSEYLREKQVRPDLLHQSILRDYEFIFLLLLQSGISPNGLVGDGKTPLAVAVVSHQYDCMKRLEYIITLLNYGADPFLVDRRGDTPFKRLCGMENNYPECYEFFRDYLFDHHPKKVQNELNEGLCNAMFNGCLPIIGDLLERGSILPPLLTINDSIRFLQQMSATIFSERRQVALVDSIIRSLIEVIGYDLPCEDYSTFLEKFIELIFIPGICFRGNDTPNTKPSPHRMKELLYHFYHYGYLNKTKANEIRTNLLPMIINTPITNRFVLQVQRQAIYDMWCQYFDEMNLKYYQNPPLLRVLSVRKIRRSMKPITRTTVGHLTIATHLQNQVLPALSANIEQ